MVKSNITITTRVVLTEKVPFLVDFFNGTDEVYFGTLLVRPCVSEEELINYRRKYPNCGVLDCYIIVEEGIFQGSAVFKKRCKKAKKK